MTSSKWPPKPYMDIRKYLKPYVRKNPEVKPPQTSGSYNNFFEFSRSIQDPKETLPLPLEQVKGMMDTNAKIVVEKEGLKDSERESSAGLIETPMEKRWINQVDRKMMQRKRR